MGVHGVSLCDVSVAFRRRRPEHDESPSSHIQVSIREPSEFDLVALLASVLTRVSLASVLCRTAESQARLVRTGGRPRAGALAHGVPDDRTYAPFMKSDHCMTSLYSTVRVSPRRDPVAIQGPATLQPSNSNVISESARECFPAYSKKPNLGLENCSSNVSSSWRTYREASLPP
jgi:hypothetical protein